MLQPWPEDPENIALGERLVALYKPAHAAIKSGDVEAARKEIDAVRAAHPWEYQVQVRGLYHLAAAHANAGDFESARATNAEAREVLERESRRIHDWLLNLELRGGYIEFADGNLDEAADQFLTLMQGDPDSRPAWLAVRWWVECLVKQEQDVPAALRKIAEEHDGTMVGGEALVRLGIHYARQGNLDAARATWEEIIERYPDSKHSERAEVELNKRMLIP